MKNILARNLGWKIVALLLALVLWFHLATEKIYEKTFEAKLLGEKVAANLFVDEISPPVVDVSVSATGKQLLKLSLADVMRIRLDLSGYDIPGEYVKYITQADLYDVDASVFRRVSFSPSDRIKIVLKQKS